MKKQFWIFLGLAFVHGYLLAHPHMWIRGQLTPELGKNGLEAVRVIWDMDELTSSYLILDYDKDRNKALSTQEVANLEANAFVHLAEMDYYLSVERGGNKVSLKRARNFHAFIKEGRVIYEFRVPLSVHWDDLTDTGLYLFDQTFFIDFRPEDMADITVSYEGRDVLFRRSRMRSSTLGYGMIEFSGLQAVSVE